MLHILLVLELYKALLYEIAAVIVATVSGYLRAYLGINVARYV
ncbi:hypothetical protein [European catfish virus]|uniref:Uncharacterized protein n=1 Tax=European catfish virus TaxID=84739 RepID=I2BFQ8_9VIRU|nr:hypothetical protein A190_gp078 [European catfish virus]AFJ52361.1 hypothetical protein [European catfish virus]AMZ05043.1 hypothetical protein [European catfish virus]